jgi:hypothetical protein
MSSSWAESTADSMLQPPEPPVGTWVIDRYGAVSKHQEGGGWGEPGFMSFGQWLAMWEARGPLVECEPWGRDRCRQPSENPSGRGLCTLPRGHTSEFHCNDFGRWRVVPPPVDSATCSHAGKLSVKCEGWDNPAEPLTIRVICDRCGSHVDVRVPYLSLLRWEK